MEFDVSKFNVSRVYTAVNADELKVGSKVIVADNLAELKAKVEADTKPVTLRCIEPDDRLYRFLTIYPHSALAYLVSEPEVLKWTDLKVGDIITNDLLTAMVTGIDSDPDELHIYAGDVWYSDEELKEWRKVE